MPTILIAGLVLGAIGVVLGLGLAIASKYLAVEVDSRVEDITKMLPGYNCGACGNPGCSGMAEQIVAGSVERLSVCKPGKPDQHFEPILKYLEEHPGQDGVVIKVKI